MLLLCAGLAQGAFAQMKIIGPGFTADPNGYRSDESIRLQQQKVAPGAIIKDCPECPEMVVLPSDSFLMGSPPDPGTDPFSNEKPKAIGSSDEKPQHLVQIQSFAIGKYEVTQEQWYAVMGNNPSENKGRTLPLEQVSWDDTQQFIAKLNQMTGQKYRLPSESEWEYAARARTTTEWSHGNDESKLGNYAWFGRNSGGKTQEAGQKLPNAFGLYDMHGNVWEWTQDCWHNNYAGAPTDGSVWTTGCTTNIRVLRGGSWNYSPAHLRSAFRIRSNPDLRGSSYGFRLARDIKENDVNIGSQLTSNSGKPIAKSDHSVTNSNPAFIPGTLLDVVTYNGIIFRLENKNKIVVSNSFPDSNWGTTLKWGDVVKACSPKTVENNINGDSLKRVYSIEDILSVCFKSNPEDVAFKVIRDGKDEIYRSIFRRKLN